MTAGWMVDLTDKWLVLSIFEDDIDTGSETLFVAKVAMTFHWKWKSKKKVLVFIATSNTQDFLDLKNLIFFT